MRKSSTQALNRPSTGNVRVRFHIRGKFSVPLFLTAIRSEALLRGLDGLGEVDLDGTLWVDVMGKAVEVERFEAFCRNGLPSYIQKFEESAVELDADGGLPLGFRIILS